MIKFVIVGILLIVGAIVFGPQIEYFFPSTTTDLPAALQEDLGEIGPKIQSETSQALDTLTQATNDAIAAVDHNIPSIP